MINKKRHTIALDKDLADKLAGNEKLSTVLNELLKQHVNNKDHNIKELLSKEILRYISGEVCYFDALKEILKYSCDKNIIFVDDAVRSLMLHHKEKTTF